MNELEQAETLANRILDGKATFLYVTSGPNADPDDDVHILARQFLRVLESLRIAARASWWMRDHPE